MAKRYYEKDGNLNNLKGRTVAIIGYGSQGHAHALNLRDSGLDVVVGLYKGSKSWEKALAAGLKVVTTADAAKAANVIMILVSDHIQGDLYNKEIAPHMTAGKTLMFAHGFNIHFKQITPPPNVDISMIAPKAPGHRVRELFTEGVGVPALVAIHQNASGQALDRALAYARFPPAKNLPDHPFSSRPDTRRIWSHNKTTRPRPTLVCDRLDTFRCPSVIENGRCARRRSHLSYLRGRSDRQATMPEFLSSAISQLPVAKVNTILRVSGRLPGLHPLQL